MPNTLQIILNVVAGAAGLGGLVVAAKALRSGTTVSRDHADLSNNVTKNSSDIDSLEKSVSEVCIGHRECAINRAREERSIRSSLAEMEKQVTVALERLTHLQEKLIEYKASNSAVTLGYIMPQIENHIHTQIKSIQEMLEHAIRIAGGREDG